MGLCALIFRVQLKNVSFANQAWFELTSINLELLVVPAHLDLIAEQTAQPIAAPHPATARLARLVFNRNAINRLAARSRPEKWASADKRRVRVNQTITVIRRPILDDSSRTRRSPVDRTDDQQQRKRNENEQEIFHDFNCSNVRDCARNSRENGIDAIISCGASFNFPLFQRRRSAQRRGALFR